MRTLKPGLMVALAITLSACAARTPPPAIEVRAERYAVPVVVQCIKAADVPAMPARIGDRLTGNAVADADLLAAANLRLRSALDQALALISGCVK